MSITLEKYREEKGYGVAESEGWAEAFFMKAQLGFRYPSGWHKVTSKNALKGLKHI